MKSTKKAFTLMEMAIVIIIIAILVGTYMGAGKSAIQNSKISSTKTTLEEIKTNLISYASIHGNLPSTNSGSGIEDLPYIDLNVKATDSFGMNFKYDVNSSFVTSDDSNICRILTDANLTTSLPLMANESNVSKYSAVAVIISTGINKTLDGENNDGDRIYSMSTNKYNETNDDLLIELTYYELLYNICSFSDFNHTR